MKKKQTLVIKNKLHCEGCDNDYFGFSEAPDEGFGYAAILYECNKCFTYFFHSHQDELYIASVEDVLADKICGYCYAELKDTLDKCDIIGVCPNCKKRDLTSVIEVGEEYIYMYHLYS